MNILIGFAIFIVLNVALSWFQVENHKNLKPSRSTFRFILAFPFGWIAEFFAMICILISGNQCDLDFNHMAKYMYKDDEE